MDEKHPAPDQHNSGDLMPAEWLIPKEMAEHGDNSIASSNRGKGRRDWNLPERQDIKNCGKDVERKADYRQRVEELCCNCCRVTRGRLERELPGNAEHNSRREVGIVESHIAYKRSCNRMGACTFAADGRRLRSIHLTTDCGFPLAVRYSRPRYSPTMPRIIS